MLPRLSDGCLRLLLLLLAAAGLEVAAPSLALAADFKSVGDAPAVLYDAPTLRGRKMYVAPRGMPVEIVVVQNDWDRVRDSSGEFSWVEKRSLSDKRTLVATNALVAHSAANEQSPAVFRLEAGVLVELVDTPVNGFVQVRHRDGVTGWVKISDVWGL